MIEPKICILSNLEIPEGKESREHYLPKNRTIKKLWNDPRNVFWAHYVLNSIKGDYLPCEWQELRWALTYNAIHKWRIQDDDKEFLRRAMRQWENGWSRNPCDLCLGKCKIRE